MGECFGDVWDQRYIVIGLGQGANIALDAALAYHVLFDIQNSVSGMVLCGGRVGGLKIEQTIQEESRLQLCNNFMQQDDRQCSESEGTHLGRRQQW